MTQPTISESIAALVAGVRKTYFQTRRRSIHVGWRFACAWAGATTLLVSSTLYVDRFATSNREIFVQSAPQIMGAMAIGGVFFGTLVAVANKNFGPVQLFLSGLLLPAVTISIIRLTWGIQ